MASIKRPTYKVETKLAVDRKRRKSDLVLMWQSIWGVTAIIVNELWMTIIRMWEFIQLCFSSSERFLVQTWLEKYLPYVPEDFSESWRDGCLMAILLNKLRPGCFPDAYRLDPDYGLKNVYRVFDALEIYFGIKPNASVEEIVTCSDGSDSKLFEIFLELKKLTENQPENQGEPELESQENVEQSSVREICIPKGAGLAVGFVGKIANFILCYAVTADLDIVVEIRGPNSICSERITRRSPKKKRSVGSWEDTRPQLTRTTSYNKEKDNNDLVTEEDENFENRIIPLEYEIIGNQIRLSYKPKEKGKHKVTILWHGRHIPGSPYTVTVEDPSEISSIKKVMYLKSSLKTKNECERNEISKNSRKISVRFRESEGNDVKEQKKLKILSRRVLKYIVKINGKFIPVNAENTESLATELLKMDYDFDKCSSSHRRNSWGFTGDAERKKSVIRQFCVDVNELDSQISQRRSRSLSVSPGPKNLLQKSDSFDSLTSNLNIVNEVNFENPEKAYDNETDYAYINEDPDEVNRKEEVTHNDADEVYAAHTNTEKETLELSSELPEGKFVESLRKDLSSERDAEVSSLSTDVVSKERVDDYDRDLQLNRESITLAFNGPCVGKIIKVSLDNQSSSDMELHPENQENESENKGNDSKTPSSLPVLNSSRGLKNNSKVKNCDKCSCSCLLKRYRTKRIVEKCPPQTFRRKVSRKKNSLYLSPTSAFRNLQGNSKHVLKTEKSLKYLENGLKYPVTSDVENEKDEIAKDAEDIFIESLDVSIDENDTPSIKEQCIKNIEENKLTEEIHRSKNLMHNKETEINCIASKNLEPKVKNFDLERNSNTISKFLPHSKIGESKPLRTLALKSIKQFVVNHSLSEFPTVSDSETKYDEEAKSLRIHSLKAIGEFNFKQFTPYFENQNSISPIKLQIGHWESTLSDGRSNASLKKIFTPDTEQVSVKEKLAFWENACQTERIPSQQQQIKNYRKIDLMESKKSIISTEDNSDAENKDLYTVYSTGNKSNTLVSIVEGETENGNSIIKETNLETKNQADDKIPSKLQLTSSKVKIRSFSDPVILETATGEPDILVNFSPLESSKNVFSSSSTDDNLEQCDSENSEDSGCDYILHSTEDEYIDDEISENASEFWGDLSVVKGWEVARDTNGNSYSYLEEFLQSCQQNKSYPGECKVFGIAVYYGHVAIKNRFQVYTGDAGFGNLSVSMQGFRQYDVSLVSVAYVRNDIYEVTYQVMTAGYYLILIRWMDKEIHGSPFVCKVTF